MQSISDNNSQNLKRKRISQGVQLVNSGPKRRKQNSSIVTGRKSVTWESEKIKMECTDPPQKIKEVASQHFLQKAS